MDQAFGWIGKFMEAIADLIPRFRVVPITHGGVSFVKGKNIKVIKPGLYWHWPLWTDFTIIPVVRQSLNLPSQPLITADDKVISISVVIVYEVNDVETALTVQHDLDDTLQDIALAAVREYTIPRTLHQLRVGNDDRLCQTIRKRVSKYGVNVLDAWVTDLAPTKVITLVGSNGYVPDDDDE